MFVIRSSAPHPQIPALHIRFSLTGTEHVSETYIKNKLKRWVGLTTSGSTLEMIRVRLTACRKYWTSCHLAAGLLMAVTVL
jgi:hypothetical protein